MIFLSVLVDVAGLAIGLALLFKRRERSGALLDLLRIAAWTMVLALIAAALVVLTRHSLFGVLRIWCHVLFCVLAPLLMVAGAKWALRGRRVALGLGLVLLGLSMEAVYVYARRVEPFALETNVHRIASSRLAGLEGPLRVVVLADLQTDDLGAYEEGALQRIDALEADLLLLAGDYLQVATREAYTAQHRLLLEALGRMKHRPRYGAYAVMGDTEHDPRMFEGTFIRMLSGETVALDGIPLQVLGLAYDDTFHPLRAEHWSSIAAYDGLTIVLGHRPDFMQALVRREAPVPIVGVAGHTHGGQIVVPGFGPPITLCKLPRRYASGVHALNGSWLCVSRGVGMERLDAPRIRLFCAPEIVVLELHATD